MRAGEKGKTDIETVPEKMRDVSFPISVELAELSTKDILEIENENAQQIADYMFNKTTGVILVEKGILTAFQIYGTKNLTGSSKGSVQMGAKKVNKSDIFKMFSIPYHNKTTNLKINFTLPKLFKLYLRMEGSYDVLKTTKTSFSGAAFRYSFAAKGNPKPADDFLLELKYSYGKDVESIKLNTKGANLQTKRLISLEKGIFKNHDISEKFIKEKNFNDEETEIWKILMTERYASEGHQRWSMWRMINMRRN